MTAETKTDHPHIVRVQRAAGDTAVVKGTNIAVWFIVRQLRVADSPEDVAASLPHLTLTAVYDAMSYYHDHRDEIDLIIERGDREVAIAENSTDKTDLSPS